MTGIYNFIALAVNQVAPEPGFIVRPIANLFGHVINFLFNIVYAMTPAHSLGLTIILATIVMRLLMLPLNLNMQKNMAKMREIQPEINKIKEKYGDSKDPEIKKKMMAEQQALMAKHGANPLKGCFPMLLTMPVFIGFNFILRQAFLYINRLGDLYDNLAEAVLRAPNSIDIIEQPIMYGLIPSEMHRVAAEARQLLDAGLPIETVRAQVGDFIDAYDPSSLARVLNRFSPENWDFLYSQIPEYYANAIMAVNERIDTVETFFGLSMVDNASWTWPSVIVPFLVGITMMISMYIGNLRASAQGGDDKAKMQQRIMVVVMPVFIGAITFGMPAGVGLFWIVTQVLQGIQDLVLNKKAGVKFVLPFMKKDAEVS